MKRIVTLLLALLLGLSAICCAAAEGVTFTTPYFTITLPDDWDFDTTPLDDEEDEEGFEYLGLFGSTEDVGILAMAYLVYYEDLTDISLWNADEDDMALYIEAILDDFEDDDPELLGTVTAGSIPFVLIRGTDEDGEYLYADTMTNGYAIEIEAFVLDEDGETQLPFTDEYIEQFKSILETFLPVT